MDDAQALASFDFDLDLMDFIENDDFFPFPSRFSASGGTEDEGFDRYRPRTSGTLVSLKEYRLFLNVSAVRSVTKRPKSLFSSLPLSLSKLIGFSYICEVTFLGKSHTYPLRIVENKVSKAEEQQSPMASLILLSVKMQSDRLGLPLGLDLAEYYGGAKLTFTVKLKRPFHKDKIISETSIELSQLRNAQFHNPSQRQNTGSTVVDSSALCSWGSSLSLATHVLFDGSKHAKISQMINTASDTKLHKEYVSVVTTAHREMYSNSHIDIMFRLVMLQDCIRLCLEEKKMKGLTCVETNELVERQQRESNWIRLVSEESSAMRQPNERGKSNIHISELHFLAARAPTNLFIDILRALSQKSVLPKALELRSSEHYNVLDYALLNRRETIVKALLQRCGSLCFRNIRSGHGSPLHSAVRGGSVSCLTMLCRYLIRYGNKEALGGDGVAWSSTMSMRLNWKDSNGDSPIGLACRLLWELTGNTDNQNITIQELLRSTSGKGLLGKEYMSTLSSLATGLYESNTLTIESNNSNNNNNVTNNNKRVESILVAMVKVLIEFGSDPSSENSYTNTTPLMYACGSGSVAMVELLLSSQKTRREIINSIILGITDADLVNYRAARPPGTVAGELDIPNSIGTDMNSRLHGSRILAAHLKSNAKSRNILSKTPNKGGFFNPLAKFNCKPVNKDSFGRQAVHYAAECGHNQLVCRLLAVGVSLLELDQFGNSLFHISARNGNRPLLTLLIDMEESIRTKHNRNGVGLDKLRVHLQILHLRNAFGNTAIDEAYNHGFVELTVWLIQKAVAMYSPLESSIASHYVELLEKLIRESAENHVCPHIDESLLPMTTTVNSSAPHRHQSHESTATVKNSYFPDHHSWYNMDSSPWLQRMSLSFSSTFLPSKQRCTTDVLYESVPVKQSTAPTSSTSTSSSLEALITHIKTQCDCDGDGERGGDSSVFSGADNVADSLEYLMALAPLGLKYLTENDMISAEILSSVSFNYDRKRTDV